MSKMLRSLSQRRGGAVLQSALGSVRGVTTRERVRRQAYDLSPTLRDFPTSQLMPDKEKVDANPYVNQDFLKDPRREHSSGFLFTPAAQEGSRVYRDETALRADVETLVAAMVPLNTLKALGEKLQPRAQIKWTKYVQEVERLAEMMSQRLFELLALPASASFVRAEESLGGVHMRAWSDVLVRFLHDARAAPATLLEDDDALGRDWELFPDPDADDEGGSMDLYQTLYALHQAHWTRAKQIVVPFPPALVEVTQTELADIQRRRNLHRQHAAADHEARALSAVLEERFTMAEQLRASLNAPDAAKLSAEAQNRLESVKGSLGDKKESAPKSAVDKKARKKSSVAEMAKLEAAAEAAASAILWEPLIARAESEGRAHLVPRIDALRQAASFEGAEGVGHMLKALDLDPELQAFVQARAQVPEEGAALSALQASQRALQEFERKFPEPTHVPLIALFNADAEREAQRRVDRALREDAATELQTEARFEAALSGNLSPQREAELDAQVEELLSEQRRTVPAERKRNAKVTLPTAAEEFALLARRLAKVQGPQPTTTNNQEEELERELADVPQPWQGMIREYQARTMAPRVRERAKHLAAMAVDDASLRTPESAALHDAAEQHADMLAAHLPADEDGILLGADEADALRDTRALHVDLDAGDVLGQLERVRSGEVEDASVAERRALQQSDRSGLFSQEGDELFAALLDDKGARRSSEASDADTSAALKEANRQLATEMAASMGLSEAQRSALEEKLNADDATRAEELELVEMLPDDPALLEDADEDVDEDGDEGEALDGIDADDSLRSIRYTVNRLAAVDLGARKVWLSEVWLRPGDEDEDELSEDRVNESMFPPHLVRESVVDIPSDWLAEFKAVKWPQRTMKVFEEQLQDHLRASQQRPAVISALNGKTPLE